MTAKPAIAMSAYKPRLNTTTNENFNNFNRTKNSVAMDNMEKRINKLFFNDTSHQKKSI